MVRGTEIEDIPAIVRYFKTQLTKLRVDIRLGKEFSPAMLDEIKPDAVILAAGGVPYVQDIPGINSRNVLILSHLDKMINPFLRLFGPELVRWGSKFYMPGGKKIVVIGGSYYGLEVAELLVRRGKKVTIVEERNYMGENMHGYKREPLLHWLEEKGATLMTGVKYEKVTEKGLVVTNREGQRQTIEADTIMPSTLLNPNTVLLKGIEGKVPEVYAVGDSKESGLIKQAISDAYHTARII
jgi:pyruvate/2-oxoglutarate dehydrogenase complex dihydrolipoamide dehydrogenase (E3) component